MSRWQIERLTHEGAKSVHVAFDEVLAIHALGLIAGMYMEPIRTDQKAYAIRTVRVWCYLRTQRKEGQAMTTNQTIDGVPRKLAERFAQYAESGKVAEPSMIEELRALLDAPIPFPGYPPVPEDRKLPAAQPQVEPVAKCSGCNGKGSVCIDWDCGEWMDCPDCKAPADAEGYPDDPPGTIYGDEQPAPVAVTLQQVLKAYDYAESHPHKYLCGTTNWCAAVAYSLNSLKGAK